MQEAGKLCANLEELNGELVRPVVRWLSLRNRLSVVSGWLADPRLALDGCLSAGAAGIASSHRQRHTVVVNVPKAEDGIILGKEMRSLFTARPGRVLVGYDAAALEANVEAHYCLPYEGGEEYAHELTKGDIHLKTASEVFYVHVKDLFGTDDYHKDHPVVKPWRNKAKSIKYGISYGAQAPKIAKMLGVEPGEGERIYAAFWLAAKPLAAFKEKLTHWWETAGNKSRIKAIDGRWLYSRSKHSLTNLVFQSCGAIIMDYSAMLMDKWLGRISVDSSGVPCYNYKGEVLYRVLYQHDELGWDVPEHLAEEIGAMGVKSIEAAARYLKIRVPITGEFKIGKTWRDTH